MDDTLAEVADEKTIKRRNHAGPLPRAIYDLFLNCLRVRSSATLPRWRCQWPSGPELKAAGFPKPKGGITRREKFKNWAERMDVRFDSEENRDVLVYRRTGKIIVPIEEFEAVIKKVHSEGHGDAKKTFSLVQQKYTVGHRDFGIDKSIINVVVETCPVCLMGTRFKRSNGIKNGSSCHLVNDKLPHLGFNGKCSSETLSMVANVPDSKCMWFDKSVLSATLDFNSKLQGLVTELRGEIGTTLRGSKDARERLLRKISIAQFIVKEHRISSPPLPTEIPEYNQKFIDDMKSLLENYRQQDKEKLFRADMELLAEAYREAGYTDLFVESVEALIRSLLAR
ncbi:uncharacterized protein [Acropora muricata]|uniref:uncharacterized protein n=1 Tax=Acropora muricata TaxID=159855 RepID=UPI0034E5E11E